MNNHCTICGKFHDGSGYPTNTGWQCPVCGCGNAPFAMTCGHCVPKENNKHNFGMGIVSVTEKVDKLNNTNAPAFIEIEHD